MAVNGDGNFPFRSAWLGKGRGRGANPRSLVNTANKNSANNAVWTDFFFEATGPFNQTLTPALYTNTQTFYAATVTAIGGTQSLTPSLFTNGQTFFAPTVTSVRNLTPALVTNGQTFFAPTVTATRNLTPALFTNGQTFYSPARTSSNIVALSLLSNGQTFYAATVSQVTSIAPALFTNGQTFFAATVTTTRALTPSLFTNGQTFYSPTATNLNIIAPPMFADSDFVFPPVVTQIGPSQTLTASLFTNSNTFFPATVADPPVEPILSGGTVTRPRRKFRPAILFDLPEEEVVLPDVSAKTRLAGLSATLALGSVVATSPDPIDARASLAFTHIETYMRGVTAASSWNDPSDEELLLILDFALS